MSSKTSLNLNSANRLVLEAFDSGWRHYVPEYPSVFNQRSPERVDEKFSITTSAGILTPVAEGASFPTVDVQEAGVQTVSQVPYKRSIPVTTLMQRFDNYGVVISEAQKLGYYARLTMDLVGANVFNNAVGTTTTWDGLSFGNASHLIGNTGVTQSNRTTGPLSNSVLNSAQVQLRNMKDHNGAPMGLMPRTLVVTPTEMQKGFELTVSPGNPESANRNDNMFATMGLNLVVWEQLTDTSMSFLLSEKFFTRLEYLTSLEPKIEYIRNPINGNYEYQLEFACSAGAVDYLGAVVIK